MFVSRFSHEGNCNHSKKRRMVISNILATCCEVVPWIVSFVYVHVTCHRFTAGFTLEVFFSDMRPQ